MIRGIFFSPTGTTEKVVKKLCENVAAKLDVEIVTYSFTESQARKELNSFMAQMDSKRDVLIIGVPVYAGRVPNVLLKTLEQIPESLNGIAVPVVVYGNRHYDAALNELGLILYEKGYRLASGAAFIGEHAFSKELAAQRPDAVDEAEITRFAERTALVCKEYIENHTTERNPDNSENERLLKEFGGALHRTDLPPYYRPKDTYGNPVDFRPIKPVVNDHCTGCGICSNSCPMGSIQCSEKAEVTGICIKCCSCVKRCPEAAISFDDPVFIRHKEELEAEFKARRKPESFF